MKYAWEGVQRCMAPHRELGAIVKPSTTHMALEKLSFGKASMRACVVVLVWKPLLALVFEWSIGQSLQAEETYAQRTAEPFHRTADRRR